MNSAHSHFHNATLCSMSLPRCLFRPINVEMYNNKQDYWDQRFSNLLAALISWTNIHSCRNISPTHWMENDFYSLYIITIICKRKCNENRKIYKKHDTTGYTDEYVATVVSCYGWRKVRVSGPTCGGAAALTWLMFPGEDEAVNGC